MLDSGLGCADRHWAGLARHQQHREQAIFCAAWNMIELESLDSEALLEKKSCVVKMTWL